MNSVGTVVIPVFNGEEYLSSAILSALNSPKSEWSVLVSNNGSTDRTQFIIDEFREDKRVDFLIWPATFPVLQHFAFALREVQTKFVCFLGHDDELGDGTLEAATRLLQNHPEVHGVIPTVLNLFPDGTRRVVLDSELLNHLRNSNLASDAWFLRRKFPGVNAIYGVWRTEYLRSIFESLIAWIDVSNPFSDRALVTALLARGEISFLPSAHLTKRVRPASMNRLSLRQEYVGFRQIFCVLQATNSGSSKVRKMGQSFMLIRSLATSLLASARSGGHAPHQ